MHMQIGKSLPALVGVNHRQTLKHRPNLKGAPDVLSSSSSIKSGKLDSSVFHWDIIINYRRVVEHWTETKTTTDKNRLKEGKTIYKREKVYRELYCCCDHCCGHLSPSMTPF